MSFKCECDIIMQIQYTKNLNPGRFELGTRLPNRSIEKPVQEPLLWRKNHSFDKFSGSEGERSKTFLYNYAGSRQERRGV